VSGCAVIFVDAIYANLGLKQHLTNGVMILRRRDMQGVRPRVLFIVWHREAVELDTLLDANKDFSNSPHYDQSMER
jgi:hypothetical protein